MKNEKLKFGFLLLPKFTLVAFSGFVDTLRLAADDADKSKQLNCSWEVIGKNEPITSSAGIEVIPTKSINESVEYDYIVVVGGLLHGGQDVPPDYSGFLKKCDKKNIPLIGLCTGTFLLARVGLMDGYLSCVSWFHHEEFASEFPKCRVTSSQMFVADRQRLTCAGGTSVVHLAAHIIEKEMDKHSAVKAMRILIEDQPLPSRTLQPENMISEKSTDSTVRKAMLLFEQDFNVLIEDVCLQIGIGRRQLERRFFNDIKLSPAAYKNFIRMDRAKWLLLNTDLDVMEISLKCGYKSVGSFSRGFRSSVCMSPSEFRSVNLKKIK